MSITLTANYQDVLQEETVDLIEELLLEDYELDEILKFIDEYNEADFVNYYLEYQRVGEIIGFDAVDALIDEDGVDAVEDCEERYRGCYDSTADFAEEYYNDLHDIPGDLIVDWEATWDSNLSHRFSDYSVGYRQVHIFSDY